MIRRDRLWLGVAAAAFLGLLAWWLYYVPYAPARLYRPIPDHAAVLSAHRGLPERWEDLARNPVARSLFRSLGADPDEVAAVTQDPKMEALLNQLAGRDVVLAYVPSLGPGGQPAWVATSWIGGRSHQLRWLVPFLEIEGLEPEPLDNGHTLWTVNTAALRGDLQPSVALLEGMLVCCLSGDPGAMRHILDCYDGIRPSMASVHGETERVRWLLDGAAPDRGWVLPGVLGGRASGDHAAPVLFEFHELTADRIRGAVRGDVGFATNTSSSFSEPVAVDDLGRLLGDLPLVVASLRRDLAEPLLAGWDSSSAEVALELLSDLDAPHVAVALLGGNYSGRLKGIRVPTLLVGVQTSDKEVGVQAMRRALDGVNAHHRLGAIPRAYGTGDAVVYRIEATKDSVYGRLAAGEKAGFACTGDWLLVGSNFSALQRIMDRYARGKELAASDEAAGWAQVWSGPSLSAAWLDLEKGGKTARLALTAYSLKLLFQGPGQSDDTLTRISEAKAWIDALSTLEICRIRLDSKDGKMTFQFNVGP